MSTTVSHHTTMSKQDDSTPVLGFNRYGKSYVRVFKLKRHTSTHHDVSEVRVRVLLEGDKFSDSYLQGDNALVVPTDTVKNTIYAIAQKHSVTPIEKFAVFLSNHFIEKYSHVQGINVLIEQTEWVRTLNGKHGHAFTKTNNYVRFARAVVNDRFQKTILVSGIRDFGLLKTTKSGFTGYDQSDPYTTLKPVTDRFMRTTVYSEWQWANSDNIFKDVNNINDSLFDNAFTSIKRIIEEGFSGDSEKGTYSVSVQATLYDAGVLVLNTFNSLNSIFFSMPNLHVWEYDVEKLGLKSDGTVFYPAEEPFGVIEAFVNRKSVQNKCGQRATISKARM